MTERHTEQTGSEEDIRKLLAAAGPRRQPPADMEARIRAATMEAVAALPDPERTSFWSAPRLATAAALAIAVLVGFLLIPDSRVAPAGSIAFSSGAYTVRGSGLAGDELAAGSIVRTSSSGRMLIDLGKGRTVRLDHDASLTLHDGSEIWLHRGRIYVDSRMGSQVTVVTPDASITDIGTQFEVTVDDESLVVATREGRIQVTLGTAEYLSQAKAGVGETLKIEGLDLVHRAPTPTVGDRWAWTQLARPSFAAQGRSILDYLEWAAREEGKQLRFTTPLATQQAELRTLHATGEIDAGIQTIGHVLATSAFELVPGKTHEIVVALKSGR